MTDSASTLSSLDTKIGVIIERLDTIDKYQLKTTAQLELLTAQIVEFTKEYIAGHVTVENKINSAHVRIDVIEKGMEKRLSQVEVSVVTIQKMLAPIVSANKIMAFLAATLGISVVGLIWSIIIGHVQLVFP